ncbi:YolD-like protein [Bacillus sp. AG236]|nr:YolD-like protein [Bacillus sp. AG236]
MSLIINCRNEKIRVYIILLINYLTEEQMEHMDFTLIEALHTNKQVYLTYYKRGQCITDTGFIQFVDSLGDLFIFIDDVFGLKNKMRLSELVDVRFA